MTSWAKNEGKVLFRRGYTLSAVIVSARISLCWLRENRPDTSVGFQSHPLLAMSGGCATLRVSK